MSFNTWTPRAVSSEARHWLGAVWRMVEAQHTASTMKIVDSRDEQDVLESLLEGNKPALPKAAEALDYLLATPFRYNPRRGGSRFRAATDPGVFYGAQSVRTAGAELGYWRWKFLKDSPLLDRLEPVAHTAFRADISMQAVDLQHAPFAVDAGIWMHPDDYTGTQRFAQVAREAAIGGIVYRSVRDPEPAWCVALLTPTVFAKPRPRPDMQTWWLAVQQDAVIWRRYSQAMTFAMTAW
ncbi:RES family NAD+ phosphorylase [Dechloromonas sp. A34]|uniref:RES family NAD+ phosphorylase n=1 Tax=Dechloromonas sp. A34 TaxID=447588 RepID=UPI0022488618|nr:RES family NAD+ phosphorylase [Dechloromonas sp. A34]